MIKAVWANSNTVCSRLQLVRFVLELIYHLQLAIVTQNILYEYCAFNFDLSQSLPKECKLDVYKIALECNLRMYVQQRSPTFG